MSYLAGAAGRAAWQAARGEVPRGDPQRTAPGDPRRYRDAVCVPCPGCGHHVILHDLTRAGRRGRCSYAEGRVRCGCGGPPG